MSSTCGCTGRTCGGNFSPRSSRTAAFAWSIVSPIFRCVCTMRGAMRRVPGFLSRSASAMLMSSMTTHCLTWGLLLNHWLISRARRSVNALNGFSVPMSRWRSVGVHVAQGRISYSVKMLSTPSRMGASRRHSDDRTMMAPVLSTMCRKDSKAPEMKSAVSARSAHSPSTIMDLKPPAVRGRNTPSTSKKMTFAGSSTGKGGNRCCFQVACSFTRCAMA
mmetsp:Transcript_12273/g.25858  ORF Transcript_12273/g.25858 Transcript_12273/m.25858 type:complete len:219 (-) Transcript_12273:348-1004(-)